MLYGSWYMVGERCNFYFSFWTVFCPFTTRTAKKIKTLKNWKKTPRDIIILHIFTKHLPKIICCTIPDIWLVTYVIISHFGPFFPFNPSNSPKNQNFGKTEKPEDIIVLHMCDKNYDHMMRIFWDMVCERFNCYFSFGAVFYPFTTLTAQKTKILKKWKKHLKISSFCICVQKIFDQMMYSSWDMVCDRFNCYFSFWTIFCPFTPRTAQKRKILKKWKIIWVYLHFTHVYQKLWSDNLRFLRYAVRQTDGWTDRKSGV